MAISHRKHLIVIITCFNLSIGYKQSYYNLKNHYYFFIFNS